MVILPLTQPQQHKYRRGERRCGEHQPGHRQHYQDKKPKRSCVFSGMISINHALSEDRDQNPGVQESKGVTHAGNGS